MNKEQTRSLYINIHYHISLLLEGGYKGYSYAFGRVGEVVDVSESNVFIRLKKSKEIGVTTFNKGDKVYIRKYPNEKIFIIKNVGDSKE